MINNTEKTIPYRLSAADLENLRLLRGRMKLLRFLLRDEDKAPEEIETWNSDLDGPNQNSEKKIP